ncbi:MAG: hypothetical protein HY897_09480 [Deltaproteobacteria bacterium]|nr:hypothetical protein [Deltaproteobacteria bacterium]
MPKGIPRSVPALFEQFVGSLSVLIKEKVSEAVQAATNDFFASKFGTVVAPAAATPAPVRRRRRRRRGRKPGSKAETPTVRLSKHGKRLGRPPKAATEGAKPE